MRSRTLVAVFFAAAVVFPVRNSTAGAEETTLLRVFLTDGSSLISDGEPARVNDRPSLPASAVAAINSGKDALPESWVAATRTDTQAELTKVLRLDRTCQTLTKWTMAFANWRVKRADAVAGFGRLVRTIGQRDLGLGARRPDIQALARLPQSK